MSGAKEIFVLCLFKAKPFTRKRNAAHHLTRDNIFYILYIFATLNPTGKSSVFQSKNKGS